MRPRYGLWIGLLLCLTLLLGAPGAVLAQLPGPQQAGLIVMDGDGVLTTVCVTFTEPSLTGLSLLERAGVEAVVRSSSGGTAICALGGLGCPATDCFCECKTAPCQYWTYFHREADGSWRYSARGADSWPISAGDVDAWVWGDGSIAPPSLSVAEICAPVPTPTSTSTLLAIAQPTPPSPTMTPISSAPIAASNPATPASAASGYVAFAVLAGALLAGLVWRARRRS